MSKNEKRQQKVLMKKRRKDRERKKKRSANTFNASDFSEHHLKLKLIKRAKDFPIFECLIDSQWKEQGIANIVISRKQPDENLVIGVYLVDILCLGLKNTFSNANVSLLDYESELKAKIYQNESHVNCHPRLAHRIIYGALEYADKLGFKPQKDFKLSKFILDDPFEADLSFDVEFGKDGKPCFISGPDDDVDAIMRKLSNNSGEGNFNFQYPMEI